MSAQAHSRTRPAAHAVTAGLLAGLSLAPAPAVRAETLFLDLDPAHTQVMFSADHLGLSFTWGWFTQVSGRMVLDTDRPQTVTLDVRVAVASLDTGLPARDRNLLGSAWFDAATHPQMRFTATGFERTGDTEGILTGDLTLRDVTRPVRLEVRFNGRAREPFSLRRERFGFSARGDLKRSAFGMDFGTDLVGDAVTLRIEAEFLRDIDER